ncbi:MAG: alpha/beta hydrolase [Clostridia bacterium]|nr:alpha/beta hydrolase [Clostridia bacterium]
MKIFDIKLKEKYEFLGDEGRNPTLTCYLPYNLVEMGRADEMRPCMVVCPGGGYAYCSEREAEPIALKFLNWGFNVFVLNYSCAPHRYPVQLREVAATFEEIYKNANEWHCDTTKIGIIGFSAGGHLAANYSNAYNCGVVREVFPDSKKPSFSVLSYPVISANETNAHKGSFINLLGTYPEGDDVEKYSCDKLVSFDTPPTFIWHTTEDQVVPVQNSLVYATALADNNVPFSLRIYPYGVHGLSTVDYLTLDDDRLDVKTALAHQWLQDLKAWMDKTI